MKKPRQIPMSDEVYECFRRIAANRKKPKVEPMIDGRAGFLYLDKNDMSLVALHWEKYYQHIRGKYNSKILFVCHIYIDRNLQQQLKFVDGN